MDRRSSRQHSFPPLLQSGVRHHFRFNIGANELVGRSIFGPQIRAFQETGAIVCPRKIKSSNLAKPRCRAASEIRRSRQRSGGLYGPPFFPSTPYFASPAVECLTIQTALFTTQKIPLAEACPARRSERFQGTDTGSCLGKN